MHRRLSVSVTLLFIVFCSLAHGRGAEPPKPAAAPAATSVVQFVENKGQWEAPVRYEAGIPGGKVFFEDATLTYLLADLGGLHDSYFHNPKDRDRNPFPISGHAFKLHFDGANAHPEISPEGRYETYHNYFIGDDPSKWAGGVGLFARLAYHELYPGIDAVFYGQDAAVKYDFIVRQGASPDAIRMRYEGLEGMRVTPDGELVFPTAIGEFRELRPYAYQRIAGEEREVPSRFVLRGNVVRFEFPQGYDPAHALVIDPTWIFGSFTGSTADNFGFTATYDTSGALYGGGIVFGLGYPTSVGAFQTTFGGGTGIPFGTGFDMSVSKWNATGTALLWSTYLGGSDNEQPQSLIATEAGELLIYGRSFSLDFPTTVGAFQTANGGGSDIVVTKVNVNGTALIGSTYVGGAADDGLNIHNSFFQNSLYFNYGDDARGEVMLDASNNVYVASSTQSNNFPTTPGAAQTGFGGGTQDGCVFKMNPNLTTMLWGSFLGGNANDAAYSVKVDAANNAYVAGGTESPNFPVTPGAVNGTYKGAVDGFITTFNAAGTTITASTFIGTPAYDQCYFLELDASNSIFVVGQTLGAFPVSPGVYSNPGSTQFIGKYNTGLTATTFSTVFGSGQPTTDISPTAFLVDRCGFIYVSGWGGEVNNLIGNPGDVGSMPVSPGTFDPTTNDSSDFYIIILTPDAQGLEYGTYYGGDLSAEHVDGGTSRFDPELVVYQAVCAGCGANSDFPTTPGAVSQTNNSSNCNLGVFKFAFDPQDIRADFNSVTLDSCTPFPVNFTNTSTGGVSFIWDFGDGSGTVTTFNASHTYTVPGTYAVTLTVIDSNSCNIVDTMQANVTVYANPLAIANGSDTVCAGNDAQLTAFGGVIYDWSPGFSLDDSTIATPVASPTVNTTYSVIAIDANGCRDTAYVDVFVTHYVADAGPPASFCEGTGGAQLQAGAIIGGTGPYYYTWWCDTTSTFCGLDSTFDDDPIGLPSQTTWYYLQVSDSRGCLSEIDSVLLEVLPVPIADAGPDQYICQPPAPGAILQGSFSNAPGPYTFHWMPGTGLNDSTILNPHARPDTTTIYTLVGVSSNGCSSAPTTLDTLSTVTVFVLPRPIADAGPDIHTCLGDTTVIQGLGYGAGPSYTYQWTPFVGLNDSAAANPVASPPFTHIYTLVVWSNGCPSYGDSMTFWVHTMPTPDPGNISEICLGDTAWLDAFAAGDSSATYTYQWTPPLALSNPSIENPGANPDTSTWYTVVATSSWGCESPPDSVLVLVKPTPLAEAGPIQHICLGDSVVLQGSYYYASTDSANPSQIWYSWTPGQHMDDTTLAQPTVWPTQSTMYHFAVRYNTCETYDSVLVILNPGIGSFVGADTSTICGGDSTQLHAGGGLGNALITWVPATGLSDLTSFDPMAAPGDTTTYTAYISEGGCTETHTLQLNVIPSPEAAFSSSQADGCPPHAVHFTDLSATNIFHVWNFGDGSPVSNSAHPDHVFTVPGDYVVTHWVYTTGGCEDMAQTVTVHVRDTVAAAFTSDPEAPAQLSFPLTDVVFRNLTSGAASLLWDFGDGITSTVVHPTHTYSELGTFFVTLRAWTAEGCQSTVVHGPYQVLPSHVELYNVFSPNGDGINDVFLTQYTGTQPFSMAIYDRWGVQYFATTDKLVGWDGNNADGQALPEGVYYYQVAIADKEYVGSVTLVR